MPACGYLLRSLAGQKLTLTPYLARNDVGGFTRSVWVVLPSDIEPPERVDGNPETLRRDSERVKPLLCETPAQDVLMPLNMAIEHEQGQLWSDGRHPLPDAANRHMHSITVVFPERYDPVVL
jgi:hypothetical protein